ncbi:MAG: carbonic anhydrase [bacterium]
MSNLSHHCDGLILICMDWRLFQAGQILDQVKKTAGLNSADVVALAGGTKNLIDEATQNIILKHVKLCQDLHQGQKIILTNHTDCGAYGQAGTEEKLIEDLRKGREIIKANYPDMETVLILIKVIEGEASWQTECQLVD